MQKELDAWKKLDKQIYHLNLKSPLEGKIKFKMDIKAKFKQLS